MHTTLEATNKSLHKTSILSYLKINSGYGKAEGLQDLAQGVGGGVLYLQSHPGPGYIRIGPIFIFEWMRLGGSVRAEQDMMEVVDA